MTKLARVEEKRTRYRLRSFVTDASHIDSISSPSGANTGDNVVRVPEGTQTMFRK